MTEETRKLLGGYATGNLSAEEREVLFRQALTDAELFEALAAEQGLKDLLDDPHGRAQVLRATEEPRFTVLGGISEWLAGGKAKALVATGVCLVVAIGVRTGWEQQTAMERARAIPSAIDEEAPAKAAPGPEAPSQESPAARASRAKAPAAAPQSMRSKRRAEGPPKATGLPHLRAAAPAVPPSKEGSIMYALQRRAGPGEFANATLSSPVRSGEELRVQITTLDNGFLDVTAGPQRRLFAGYVKAGQSVVAPPQDSFIPQNEDEGTIAITFTRMAAAAVGALQPSTGLMYRRQREAIFEDRAKPETASAPKAAPPADVQQQNTLTIEIPLRILPKDNSKPERK